MRTTLLLIGILAITLTNAQDSTSSLRDMGTASFNISVAMPSGEFRNFYSKPSLGLALTIMGRLKESSPLYVGGELAYHNMGFERNDNINNYDVEITATSNVISLFPKIRVQSPKRTLLSPFAEALVGLNMFYSYVRVKSEDSWGDEDKNWRIHKATFKPGFGFAAGAHIRAGRKGPNIEIRSAYLFGGRTNYYTNPDISSDGQVSFISKRSRTNMLQLQLGINL